MGTLYQLYPEPNLVIFGVVLICAGMALNDRLWRFLGIKLPGRADHVRSTTGLVLALLGCGAIFRGIGFKSPYQP